MNRTQHPNNQHPIRSSMFSVHGRDGCASGWSLPIVHPVIPVGRGYGRAGNTYAPKRYEASGFYFTRKNFFGALVVDSL